MTNKTSTDVLIIGAGPTGLTLATDLMRRGVACRILERSGAANTASKAKAIQPRALEIMDDLGVAEFITSRGIVDLPTRFHEHSGAVVDMPTLPLRVSDGVSTPYPHPVWIGQFDVEAALRHQFLGLGGVVEYGCNAVTVDQDRDGVSVTMTTQRGTETVHARYVVAADGGKSLMRRLAGLPLLGETYENQRWYLGDVTTTSLDREHMHIWTSEKGMVGLTPLPNSDLWQLQSPIRPEDDPGEPSLEFYQGLLDDRAGKEVVRLTSATWLSVYRVNVRMVRHYRRGRIFLAGDAAHVHSPAGGQGMATGIQDAYNLGWKLAAVLEGADDNLLDTYELERIPVARAVLVDSTSKMKQVLSTVTGPTDQGLGGALGHIADDLTTGLTVAYPVSPLTMNLPAIDALVRPGDRAPDARGLRSASNTWTLFDLLRGPHWSLIAFEHPDPESLRALDPERRRLRVLRVGKSAGSFDDSESEFQKHYSPSRGELFLIRPDGYLAGRVSLGNESEIFTYFTELQLLGGRS